MDKQSIFFSVLTGVIATALMIMVIKAISRKQKLQTDLHAPLNISYAVWFASNLIAFFLFLKVALPLVENAIELIIYSEEIDATFITVMEKIAIFIGFTFICTFVFSYLVHQIFRFMYGPYLDAIEMERNNVGYFSLKAVVLIFLIAAVLPMFEHFLRWFMPVVETPFYR